tara:strand:+ start:198 stop:632 length:435 start_codon:yes stop_codon:yes gene_type:complete
MNLYLLFKALHLIAVISWMAGLLYLPRIFVYHSKSVNNKATNETFKVMERKLFNYIMMPSMILTWLFGILLITNIGFSIFSELWTQIKGALVFFLTYYHFYLGTCVRTFAADQNNKSSKFYKIINEVPTVLLIFIVFFVVFKPL